MVKNKTINESMFNKLFTFEHGEEPQPEKTKVCNKCRLKLPVSKFGKESGNKIRSACRECDRKVMKVRAHLRKTIPFPTVDYVCPICKRNEDEIKTSTQYMTRNVHVWSCDHDHDTGQFRAWLCNKCNLGLGNFNDNVELLKNSITYLENNVKHKE